MLSCYNFLLILPINRYLFYIQRGTVSQSLPTVLLDLNLSVAREHRATD